MNKIDKIKTLLSELESDCLNSIEKRDQYDPVIDQEQAIIDTIELIRRVIND